MRQFFRVVAVFAAAAWMLSGDSIAVAGDLTMKSGMLLQGRLGKISRIGEDPLKATGAGEVNVKQIMLIDDDLRRTFVSTLATRAAVPSAPVAMEKIMVQQRVARSGRTIGGVGPILGITRFDSWGRRVFSMRGPRGRVDVVQGITEITPTYTRVQGLLGKNPYVWDMRIATSSIPRDTLSQVMMRQIDPKNSDDRLRIVRLYIQADRIRDAKVELAKILKEFPELKKLEDDIKSLKQSEARRVLREIESRDDVGQHRLAAAWLKKFPTDGVAASMLLRVRNRLKDIEKKLEERKKIVALLDEHLGQVDDNLKAKIQPTRDEIVANLNFSTLPRMADYLRLSNDPTLNPSQKLSLAISAWVLGSGNGTENLAVATSLVTVRDLVRQYLTTTRVADREAILAQLKGLEGGTPKYVAQMLKSMQPVLETVEPALGPGFYKLSTPGLAGEPDIEYLVQLPPEYDPYRKYPCIVTLNGAGSSPANQIDWWAGTYNEKIKMRTGQATRHGYIVIAPMWTREHQKEYKYSAREHAAVLYSLRDAFKRFSVDTDKVFLSGHSMGGDAAWDIGLAHPDLWAGILPVVATSDRYVSMYSENGRYVPMYFVAGEYDGDRTQRNSLDLNRYFTRKDYDCMLVSYQGRGHEHFHDEIQRFFRWMDLHQRNFYPQDFECNAMRPWDNFFWWLELKHMPTNGVVLPLAWEHDKRKRPVNISGRVLENNGLTIDSGAGLTKVWLTPETVDFDKRIIINRKSMEIKPDVGVMLEDVRTRCDRQHPFWAVYELENPRIMRAIQAGQNQASR